MTTTSQQADSVSQLFARAPLPAEVGALRDAAEKARSAHQVESDRVDGIRAELERLQKQAARREDLDAALAAAVVADMRARHLREPGGDAARQKLLLARDAANE